MATRRWLGRAIPVKQVDTVTIANTWGAGDDILLTINGKTIMVTIGTLTTTSQVATTLKQAWNGETFTDTTAAVDVIPAGSSFGSVVGEFAEITATVSSAVVTLTADVAGRPFTLVVTEDTAGDGTATEATPTAATGPNFWDNVDNWTDDTVPVDGDTVVFDHGDIDLLYNLTTGIEPAVLLITQGYTGKIGNAEVNTDQADPDLHYDEYRGKYLDLENDAGTAACAVTIGDGVGQGSGRIKLDFADCATVTVNVRNSGQRVEDSVPSILIINTATSLIANIQKGDVGFAFFDGEAAHIATLKVGYLDNQDADVSLVLGDGADTGDASIEISGGNVFLESATGTGAIDVNGGTLNILAGAHADIDLERGTLVYRGTGTVTALKMGDGAIVDFSQDERTRTVSACDVYGKVQILDPNNTVTWSAGIDFNHSNPKDSVIDVGFNRRLTPGAVA